MASRPKTRARLQGALASRKDKRTSYPPPATHQEAPRNRFWGLFLAFRYKRASSSVNALRTALRPSRSPLALQLLAGLPHLLRLGCQSAKRDLEQEVEELREEKAALIDEIAYKDGQLYELQDAVVSKEIEIEQLKSEVKRQRSTIDRLERTISGLEERLDKAIGNIIEIADTMRWRFEPQNWRKALSRLVDNPIAHAALAVRQNVARWVEKDARAADRVIKREVKSVRKELTA